MIEPGTRAEEAVRRDQLVVPDARGLLRELREIIAETDVTHAVFRTNHASNYLALGGTLPDDKPAMLAVLDEILRQGGLGLCSGPRTSEPCKGDGGSGRRAAGRGPLGG